ncbi:BgTH12-06049 [Blumeria graminis f. sp. triticale]|uniref:BgTH12-06049 n=1 Tax=Blumeria graminis f. sp. triticale TaxID=1689686 RepID=A0A9W4D4T0_BLUGR|nr:BgTH12-06049 [Blumeria graminis f. sp. triticale]
MRSSKIAAVAVFMTGALALTHYPDYFNHAKRKPFPTGTAALPPFDGCTTTYTTITGEAVLLIPPPTITPAPIQGGIVTTVDSATNITIPYTSVITQDGVETYTELTTIFECPSAGTFTIDPLTPNTPAPTPPSTTDELTIITETEYTSECPTTTSTSALSTTTQIPILMPNLPKQPVLEKPKTPMLENPMTPKVEEPEEPEMDEPEEPEEPEELEEPKKEQPKTPKIEKPKTPLVQVPKLTVPEQDKVSFLPPANIPKTSKPKSPELDSGFWAIAYSPYRDDKGCKSAETVKDDISKIRSVGFKSIRIYGTDCSGLENVGNAAKANGLKLILGIFINDSGVSGAADQVKDILKWGQWDLVDMIVIGNEALFNKHTTPQELAGFIRSTKSSFRAAGYKGPCTTAEPLNIWESNFKTLCDVIDVVGCNIHPFFNSQVDAPKSGQFVKSQLEIVDQICPGKRGVNLECGWPSAGDCNGKACPGVSEQAKAVKSIKKYAGNSSVLFTYTDDFWKEQGEFNVEQKFGIIKFLLSNQTSSQDD